MDYIPSKDWDALAWMNQFSGVITNDNARYMLSPSDAETIAAPVAEFGALLTLISDKNKRIPANIAAKDVARAAAETVCRQYGRLIKYNEGISDSDKIAVGIPPVSNTRESIPAPTSQAILSVYAALTSSHTVQYHDANTPGTARKPAGVTQIQIFMAVAPEAVPTPETAAYYGTFTRSPIGIALNPADRGKVATYFGRWSTAKGLVGPWSPPVHMTIAA